MSKNRWTGEHEQKSPFSSWGPSTWVASGCILLWRIPRPSQDWGLLFLAWQCFQLRRTHAQTSSWQQANEGTDICDFLPLKFSHYPSRPVPVPELFCKYPTRPVPKSKTSTRRTLLIGCQHKWTWYGRSKPRDINREIEIFLILILTKTFYPPYRNFLHFQSCEWHLTSTDIRGSVGYKCRLLAKKSTFLAFDLNFVPWWGIFRHLKPLFATTPLDLI